VDLDGSDKFLPKKADPVFFSLAHCLPAEAGLTGDVFKRITFQAFEENLPNFQWDLSKSGL
jgi:hypothetical protein